VVALATPARSDAEGENEMTRQWTRVGSVWGVALAFLTGSLLLGCGDDAAPPPPDTTAPTVLSIDRVDADPTNAVSVDFTVTFSENVTGVAAANFTVTTAGTAGAVSAVTPLSASVYTVTVNTVSGDGTLRLDLDSSLANIIDSASNAMAVAFTSGQVYMIDNTPPGVTSIARVNADPTNATSVDFTVTFDENVTGVGVANFTVTTAGTAGAVSAVTPVSASVYTVTVNKVSGDGTLGLDASPTRRRMRWRPPSPRVRSTRSTTRRPT